jgi:hypothetical protein
VNISSELSPGWSLSCSVIHLLIPHGRLTPLFCLFAACCAALLDAKTGLTASVVVSQWTWAATFLQSSNVAWACGVSGPFCQTQENPVSLGEEIFRLLDPCFLGCS